MLVSIVTINYNNAQGLARTVKSVLEQTYSNIEYIIIDGGSSDNSVEIIKRNNAHIKYWVSEKDDGVFDAQNKGLKEAAGDYILVLNSGDELASASVIETVFSSEHSADILYGDMIVVEENGKRTLGTMPDALSVKHMMHDTLWHPVSFVKRSVFAKTGYYDTSFKIIADYAWFLKALFKYKLSSQHLHQTISVFYLGGMSSDSKYSEQLKKERIRAQYEVFGKETTDQFWNNERENSNSFITRIWKKLKG